MRLSCVLVVVALTPLQASAGEVSDFWALMLERSKQFPEYASLQVAQSAVEDFVNVEKTKTSPRVEGILSRVDGDSSASSTSDVIQGGLSFAVPLYEGHKPSLRESIATMDGQISYLEAKERFESILVDLAESYIRLWSVSELRDVHLAASQKVETYRMLLSEAETYGEVTLLESSRVLEKLTDIESKLILGETASAYSKYYWTGYDQTLADMPVLIGPPITQALPTAAQELKSKEYAKLREQAQLIADEKSLSVDLTASSVYRDYRGSTSDGMNNTWGIQLKYPLFDGGAIDSRVVREERRASIKLEELATMKAAQQREIDGMLSWIEAKQRSIKLTEQQCTNRKQIEEQIAARFELGRGSVADVLDATLAHFECQADRVESLTELYSRYVRFSRVTGQLNQLADKAS